jgi:flagellar hook-associated protein 3 FlgL
MGRIGLHQQTVERAATANSSALATLELSRNDIRRADPYETAAALTEVQSQLESLYAVTARLSNLNLVDYLR